MSFYITVWLLVGWICVFVIGVVELLALAWPGVFNPEGDPMWFPWAMLGGVWLALPLLVGIGILPVVVFDRVRAWTESS